MQCKHHAARPPVTKPRRQERRGHEGAHRCRGLLQTARLACPSAVTGCYKRNRASWQSFHTATAARWSLHACWQLPEDHRPTVHSIHYESSSAPVASAAAAAAAAAVLPPCTPPLPSPAPPAPAACCASAGKRCRWCGLGPMASSSGSSPASAAGPSLRKRRCRPAAWQAPLNSSKISSCSCTGTGRGRWRRGGLSLCSAACSFYRQLPGLPQAPKRQTPAAGAGCQRHAGHRSPATKGQAGGRCAPAAWRSCPLYQR